jgi:molybdenum cofactor cytidylyltransferase
MIELHAILLAAGGSSRLGRSKQLLELQGEPLVRRAARLLTEVTPRVTVITGARVELVSEALAGLAIDERHNPRWREGVGGSIALATGDFESGTRAALILLCDQYRIDAADLRALVSAWRNAPENITAARWGEKFGPPVIFPDRFFKALGRLRGDLGARQLLVEHRARVHYVDLPNAAFDVDDAADLDRLRAWERNRD